MTPKDFPPKLIGALDSANLWDVEKTTERLKNGEGHQIISSRRIIGMGSQLCVILSKTVSRTLASPGAKLRKGDDEMPTAVLYQITCNHWSYRYHTHKLVKGIVMDQDWESTLDYVVETYLDGKK